MSSVICSAAFIGARSLETTISTVNTSNNNNNNNNNNKMVTVESRPWHSIFVFGFRSKFGSRFRSGSGSGFRSEF